MVRAATRLVVADLAAALRDQPAVAEVIAWAAAVSAAGAVAGVAAAGVVAEVGDKQRRKNADKNMTDSWIVLRCRLFKEAARVR